MFDSLEGPLFKHKDSLYEKLMLLQVSRLFNIVIFLY